MVLGTENIMNLLANGEVPIIRFKVKVDFCVSTRIAMFALKNERMLNVVADVEEKMNCCEST